MDVFDNKTELFNSTYNVFQLLSSFPAQMRAFLDDLNIPYDMVNIQSLYLSSVLVQFHVALPTLNESTTEALMQVSTDLSRSTTFAGFTAIPQNSGIQVYQTAGL